MSETSIQAAGVNGASPRPPLSFAGLPGASWAFAFRIWLALIIALYVAFWLELESPSTAALTIAVLALPTRGQAVEKACYRLVATAIGVAASVIITGVFAQSAILILVAFAVWMGLCVYATSLLDGNHAYAAALCGTTVALIAMPLIDSPQMVFQASMARGAAIAIGVLAVTFVNDFLAAPDYHPKVTAQLAAMHLRFVAYARGIIHNEANATFEAANLLRDITALRPEIASLAPESSSGHARSAAARTAAVNLIAALSMARAISALPVAAFASAQERVMAELGDTKFTGAPPDPLTSGGAAPEPSDMVGMCHAWLMAKLLQSNADALCSFSALREGVYPTHPWRTPLYRSHRLAIESGVRAGLCFALIAFFLMMAGWPTTASCLSLAGVLIGLSATTPDIRAFTTLAAIVAPISCLLVGIVEFFVLDGVTDFPLLALGLAPVIIGSALLITIPNLVLSSLGRANLAFVIVVFAPSNPQSYNPQTFLFTSLFLCLSALSLFIVQFIIPPLSSRDRLRRLTDAARRDIRDLTPAGHSDLALEEAIYRDAGRIGKIAADAKPPIDDQPVSEAMRMFDQAVALRLCGEQLAKLTAGPHSRLANRAITSLVERDPHAIHASAEAMRAAMSGHDESLASASAALVLASYVFGKRLSASDLGTGDAT